MRKCMIAVLLLVCAVALQGQATKELKASDWQTGKVLDSEQASVFLGFSTRASVNSRSTTYPGGGNTKGTVQGTERAEYSNYQELFVETDTHLYVMRKSLDPALNIRFWTRPKRANLTVNGPVRFLFQKSDEVVLLDEDNREHKFRVTKKILKEDTRASLVTAVSPQIPEDMRRESSLFLEKRLGIWTFTEARQLLGEPIGQRHSNRDGQVTGDIYAYPDPTGRYKEFELRFAKADGLLTDLFIAPWEMTWEECKRTWGEDVSTTQMKDGALLHSYNDRRLAVLVDRQGNVIRFGVF